MGATPIRVLLITPEGQGTIQELAQDLRTLQTVLGGYIEAVPGLFDTQGRAQAMLWCNEEGKLQDLPINHKATALWWALDESARGMDQLMGAVLVTGGWDGEGDVLPLPEIIERLWNTVNAPSD